MPVRQKTSQTAAWLESRAAYTTRAGKLGPGTNRPGASFGQIKALPCTARLAMRQRVTRVDLPLLPRQRQAAIVWVALDQVFRDQHRRSTEVAVTLANERAVGVIDFVALVLRREQTGASVARA
jgi:hypothetical protein